MNGSTNQTNRTAEVLATVLAAFGIEQIAQGGIENLWSAQSREAGHTSGELAIVFCFSLLLVINTIRFYHGNTRYLESRYVYMHPREIRPGATSSTPLGYAVDILSHIFQYLAIILSGYALGKGQGIYGALISLVVLLVLDVLWSLLAKVIQQRSDVVGRAAEDLPWRGAVSSWLVINVVTAFLLVTLIIIETHVGTKWTLWVDAVVLVVVAASVVTDYAINWKFYFRSDASVSQFMPTDQAQEAILVLAAALQSADLLEGQHKGLGERIEALFSYFMYKQEVRSRLFLRGKEAKLHIGFYVIGKDRRGDELRSELRPVFRMYDPGIQLKNRTFAYGEDYVGDAFQRLERDRWGTITYDNRNNTISRTHDDSRGLDQYQSSVMTNVFCRISDNDEAIGLLTMTSDQESFFTQPIHGPMVRGLAEHLGVLLSSELDAARERTRKTIAEAAEAALCRDGDPHMVCRE